MIKFVVICVLVTLFCSGLAYIMGFTAGLSVVAAMQRLGLLTAAGVPIVGASTAAVRAALAR